MHIKLFIFMKLLNQLVTEVNLNGPSVDEMEFAKHRNQFRGGIDL